MFEYFLGLEGRGGKKTTKPTASALPETQEKKKQMYNINIPLQLGWGARKGTRPAEAA